MTSHPQRGVSDARARELVAAERTRIVGAIRDLDGTVREEGDLGRQQKGEAWELGTEVAAEGIAIAILAKLHHELLAADRADARIHAGTFGRSIESGELLPAGRLEAAPLAERTVSEQMAFDRRPQ